ncbi:ABC exporter membrane fusion protein [Aetokthonos hydrillicola Thurmond2011]|jgi:HlyD family secretion protein|uniref:ABC exporter membrane fusion protein n=1 Tax=Aetokthonos hydrillicola Thurmond2011 TaxID=2712845 RepID=A0AAP5MAX9_9CYAN|nr:ABC exporter membrane fusion protein [Aetokthonos hydrillicola]MBO3457172.1 ABC exporter membrane fusion protein [Aetokthonos hydrillicola CCALA 1050]MBW4587523.1 ABC exporter membrane fusion protein [Aetokthonos hydrillicola CCALA 1050]MDR9898610.1 ABC exporter membrane fusion protein [Aetokthonos hydrillicola Thurmond2011]
MVHNGSEFFKQGQNRQLVIMAMAATLAVSGVTVYRWRFHSPQSKAVTQTAQISTPQVTTVTALGRLEPKGKVIKVSAPTSSQENRVEKLLVKENQQVKAGQIIAILDSKNRLEAAVTKAQEQVRVKQVNLAQIQAGAKQGEIAAQKAQIDRLNAQWQGDLTAQQATTRRLEAELNNAQAEYQRYEQLYSQGAISKSSFDAKRLSLDTATQQLNEAKAVLTRINGTSTKQITEAQATLNKIAEVRPVDVELAKAEVNDAIAAVNQAKENLKQAYVRSPQNGQIFEIHTRPGEVVSSNGIVEIGQTSQMYVVAEVYQDQIGKIRPGQDVRVISDSLPSELQGKVDWVGLQVRRQNVVNTDPSSNIDARVVEVHVKLDNTSSQKAAKFTNLQVKAVIQL